MDGGDRSIQRLDDKMYPPTRATKEDKVVSPDLDGLLEFLLGFAQKMLPAQNSFSPFGATVTHDSRIQRRKSGHAVRSEKCQEETPPAAQKVSRPSI
jgi:hypothetical protein